MENTYTVFEITGENLRPSQLSRCGFEVWFPISGCAIITHLERSRLRCFILFLLVSRRRFISCTISSLKALLTSLMLACILVFNPQFHGCVQKKECLQCWFSSKFPQCLHTICIRKIIFDGIPRDVYCFNADKNKSTSPPETHTPRKVFLSVSCVGELGVIAQGRARLILPR